MTPTSQATAPRPTMTKTETAIVISLDTNTCYRESKFPEGHPGRKCHVGLVALDANICAHCTWYGSVQKKQVAKLTGIHRVAMVDFLKKLRDEGVPGIKESEIRPELPTKVQKRPGFIERAWATVNDRLDLVRDET